MNFLIIKTQYSKLHCTVVNSLRKNPIYSKTLENYLFNVDKKNIENAISGIKDDIKKNIKISTIVFIVPYGGDYFKKAQFEDKETLIKLGELVPYSPLHIPVIKKLIIASKKIFKGTPVSLVFQTSFFTELPERESIFALPSKINERLNLKKYGYYGIYHSGACDYASEVLIRNNYKHPFKIISVCLEPQIEIAAVIGKTPVMVTSNATPIGGIAGETTCGEIDATIVLHLSKKMGWGPEKINSILTKESGIYALTGKKIPLIDVLNSKKSDDSYPAKEIILYQIQKNIGSAIASLGGIDAVIFSGRYCKGSNIIKQFLLKDLCLKGNGNDIKWIVFKTGIEKISAELVLNKILEQKQRNAA